MDVVEQRAGRTPRTRPTCSTGFKSSVEAAWREKHPFHCTKKYWEDLGATTKIKVEVAKVANAAGKAGDQHMLVNTLQGREGLRRRLRGRQPHRRRGGGRRSATS